MGPIGVCQCFHRSCWRLNQFAVNRERYSQLDTHAATERIGDETIAVGSFVHLA